MNVHCSGINFDRRTIDDTKAGGPRPGTNIALSYLC
jgi:hypothetical protein